MRTNHKNPTGYGLARFETSVRKLENLFRLDRYIKVLILAIAAMSFSTMDSYATHFRYGNISWRQIDANTVEFQVAMAFRSNYPIPAWNGLPVGQTFTPDLTFFYGDGTSGAIQLTVTSRSISDNWSYAEGTFRKTYANPNGIYTAYFQGCCRISTLVNNSDATYRVETLINLGAGNTSPVSTIPPIINLPAGVSDASFVIPASDPDGDNLSFSPTTSAQMGSSSSNPSGFSVDANSGIATFNTAGRSIGQLYNASVTINDNNGSRIAVDFLVRIVQTSNPAVFAAPTPPSGTIFTIGIGEELSFDIKAEDPDPIDFVTLQVAGLPATATMSPALPFSGAVNSPVESSFSWTPSSTGTFIINYTAEDNNGAQTSSSVTVVVSEEVCDISLTGVATDVTCVGGSDGSITLTPTGGTAPFEYSIDNGVTYQSSNEFEGVSEGIYTAVVKDANDCTEETTLNVGQSNDLPVINTLTGPSDLSAATLLFTADVTDDNLVLAEWNWGDGETSTEVNPGSSIEVAHTYQESGIYTVTLTITDVCGETATESASFNVMPAEPSDDIAIEAFALVDADKNQIIREIKEGDELLFSEIKDLTLSFVAIADPEVVGSVWIEMESQTRCETCPTSKTGRVENVIPYALFGDINSNYNGRKLSSGKYILYAKPFAKSNRQGEAGLDHTVNFTIKYDVEVSTFVLVDSHTNQDVQIIKDGDVLNLASLGDLSFSIRGEADKSPIGSMKMEIEGPIHSSIFERVAPYALFGDNKGNYSGRKLPEGKYTLKAKAYPNSFANSEGFGGDVATIQFEVISGFAVTSYTLVNADTHQDIMELKDQDVLDLNKYGHIRLSIRANTVGEEINNVVMMLSGPFQKTIRERVKPYTLFGDLPANNYNGRRFNPGDYELTSTPYDRNNMAGGAKTIRFSAKYGANLRVAFGEQALEMKETESENAGESGKITIYPQPSNGVVNFKYPSELAENTSVQIIDSNGRIIYGGVVGKTPAFDFRNYGSGLFLLIINTDNETLKHKILIH